MKRIVATLAFALPLATLFTLPKSASAEPVAQDYSYGQHRNVIVRDNRYYRESRPSNSDQHHSYQRHRVWVPGRFVRANHRSQWVPGHYEFR